MEVHQMVLQVVAQSGDGTTYDEFRAKVRPADAAQLNREIVRAMR